MKLQDLLREFVLKHYLLKKNSECYGQLWNRWRWSESFNISSTSAFVIAAAGIPVAKHGNRSVSSKTGSADVLEELGIQLNLSVERMEEIIEEVGIAFLYAPNVHPKIERIQKVRKDLGIPTVFNLLGPLMNPVDLDTQFLGVYRRDLSRMFAEVLQALGRKRAVVLNGAGSMDEASLQGDNYLVILENGDHYEKTFSILKKSAYLCIRMKRL